MTLEIDQYEMQERQQVARKKIRRNAGSKRKRVRVSVKSLLVGLAQHTKAPGKVRAWAIQQLLLLGGKPVQPFEESHDEPEPELVPAYTGRDLGQSQSIGLPLDK